MIAIAWVVNERRIDGVVGLMQIQFSLTIPTYSSGGVEEPGDRYEDFMNFSGIIVYSSVSKCKSSGKLLFNYKYLECTCAFFRSTIVLEDIYTVILKIMYVVL